MKIPRDLSGAELMSALERIGYQPTRQMGSHVRLTCEFPSQHHVTVPLHNPLRIGTLSSILNAVVAHHKLPKDELLTRLFGSKTE